MPKFRSLVLLLLLATLTPLLIAAERMPLSDVQKGMKGYGLTVFEGTTIEKFDVEILGVVRNMGPNQNLILARIDSPVVRRAGVIAGMSGSPILIDGKVIGALAYAWQFASEPVAGITPIEEMMKISKVKPKGATLAGAVPRVSTLEMLRSIASGDPSHAFAAVVGAPSRQTASLSGARQIAVPIALSSFAPETIARFTPQLESFGFVPVSAGSTGNDTALSKKTSFEPGDPVGAVLLNGDFNVAASGTVTYVDGDHVYAFGHPFLDMGEVEFPMATSEVVSVLPSLANSFKFSNTGPVVGVLRQDRSAGIFGVLGERPDMLPVEVTVSGSSAEQTFHVNLVRHSSLSPLMLAMVADSVVTNSQRAAGERTILMESEIKLAGRQPIRLRDGWAGQQARQAIPQYLAVITSYLISNEFEVAPIESIKVNIRHDDDLKIARLLEASVVEPESGRITPGDRVQVRTVLKPFRGDAFTEIFEVRIPEDQPEGSAYLLVGSGSSVNAVDFTLVPPDPRSLAQVISVLERLRPSTDLTVGLYSSRNGAVSSGVYLSNLPPSVRAVVGGDTSRSGQADVKYHPTLTQAKPLGYIVDGTMKLNLEIRPSL